MLPILYFSPNPIPILIEIAPLPRVFQGIFGLSLTNRGKPMISNPKSVIFLIKTHAACVVQPPYLESVSSIPIQIIFTSRYFYIRYLFIVVQIDGPK